MPETSQFPMNESPSAPIVPIPDKRRWYQKYKASAVERWLGEALTQFINGFIKGWKHGVGTGAGLGVVTGTTSVAANMTAMEQIIVSGAGVALAMFMNGFNQVSSWHETNPFPNPWGPYNPNGTTAPFSPTT